jgi:hypothetical protein
MGCIWAPQGHQCVAASCWLKAVSQTAWSAGPEQWWCAWNVWVCMGLCICVEVSYMAAAVGQPLGVGWGT